MTKRKLLFVCTANLQRSPTAESMFRNSENYQAKSAGISLSSPRPVIRELIDWADIIFVFNEKNEGHKSFLLAKFPHLDKRKIIDLDIGDVYYRGEPELVKILKRKLEKCGIKG